MSFKWVLIEIICVLAVAFISGCTEKLPVDPVYTDDTDWIPSITLTNNGYQRVELTIERPPRKELLRNILSYTLQVRPGQSGEYVDIDTLRGDAIPPSYVYPGPYYYPYYYRSGPILDYGTNYAARIAVHYRSGIAPSSNEIAFTTPLERGRVLKRLPMPSKVPYDTYGFNEFLAFHKGSLLILRDEQLFRIDTATGQPTLLKSSFVPPADDPNKTFRTLTVIGDTAYTFFYSMDHFMLVSLDLNSLQVDSSLSVSHSGWYLTDLIAQGFDLYSLWSSSSSARQQFAIIDRQSGQLLHVYPDVPGRLPVLSGEISSDGTNLWFSSVSWYDNRIIRFDPSMLTFWEQHRNPIFSPTGLVWDSANFWVIDQATRTIAKLQLEGL